MTSDTAGLHPGVVKTAKQQEAARRLRKICGGDAGEEAVIIDSVDPHPYMMNRGDKRGAKTGNESQIDRMKLMPPVEVSIDGEDVRKGILKASEARSDSSNHDDSIGHFRGGAGTVIASRYQLLRDVGLGTFGRVVECRDMRVRGRSRAEFVAVKVVRSIKRYHQSALVEARIIRDINRRGGRGLSHCSILLDDFTFDDHFCMVFEILGPSLYDFMKKHQYQPFPMPCVHDFAIQLLEALEFLHSFRLIHTDMKLENILTTTVREVRYADYVIPASTRIKLIDFGGASYDWEKKSLVISTRQYRAPEVILETGWSMPADVWSVGCILAELYQGELLFCTHDDVEHLALMERVISPFPKWMLQKACEKGLSFVKEAFNADHRHHMGSVLPSKSAHFVRKARPLAGLVAPRELWFLDLLHRLLIIDPNQRSTAHEALRFLSRHEGAIVRTT